MSKEFLGDPSMEKRYVVTIDMHVYAENDHMARVKAHDLVEQISLDEKAYNILVLSIDEQPFGSLSSRELDDISKPLSKEEKDQKLPF
tara:strand:- start:9816 stop:10079 length:264 start_codon:yes stop_codon:yes gene_type:complete